jgi:hypothetical protein
MVSDIVISPELRTTQEAESAQQEIGPEKGGRAQHDVNTIDCLLGSD